MSDVERESMSAAAAIIGMAEDIRKIADIAENDAAPRNRRYHAWRWRTSVVNAQKTFTLDFPFRYWSVLFRSSGGSGLLSIYPGGGAPDLQFTDEDRDMGLGVTIPAGSFVRIPATGLSLTLFSGTGLTVVDVLIVAHNGDVEIGRAF